MFRFRAAFLVVIVGLSVIGLLVAASGGSMKPGQSGENAGETGTAIADSKSEPAFLGTWKRQVGRHSVILVIEHNRFRGTWSATDEGVRAAVDIRAEYSMSADGCVYGVVNSVGFDSPQKAEETEEIQFKLEKALMDAPFWIRIHVEKDVLTIKDFRTGVHEEALNEKHAAFLRGRYVRQAAEETRR